MGTPHWGAPICNIMCETYHNDLFFNAESTKISPSSSLGEFLEKLNIGQGILFGITQYPLIRWKDGGNPPEQTGDGNIVPSLRVMSVGSDVIYNELNDVDDTQLDERPFHDDVAYASIIGNDDHISIGFNANTWMEPVWDVPGFNTKSYFPWLSGLDGGNNESDAIVPVWSQELPEESETYGVHHLAYSGNDDVREKVRDWLNDAALPLGSAHRGGLFAKPSDVDALSRDNAYKGSVLFGIESKNAGVIQNAIVKTVLSKAHASADLTSSTNSVVLGAKGGIVEVSCTGMVDDNSRHIAVLKDGALNDVDLHGNISVPYSGTGELQTFKVTGYIGRTIDSDLLGPDGQANNPFGVGGADYYVGYEVSGADYYGWGRQSPGENIELPKYELPPPDGNSPVPSPPGNSFAIEGGVPTTGIPGGSQNVHNIVYDNDIWPNPNDVLIDAIFGTSVPSNSFFGALIPWAHDVYLFKNGSDEVAGSGGSSGEESAEVFQKLIDFGEKSSSVNIDVY